MRLPFCVLQVEASIQEALSGLAQGLSSLEQQLSEAGTSEAQLNARLEKWTGARCYRAMLCHTIEWLNHLPAQCAVFAKQCGGEPQLQTWACMRPLQWLCIQAVPSFHAPNCAAKHQASHNSASNSCAGELERAEKRLATLAGVRPPYMDEYEALTLQLQVSTHRGEGEGGGWRRLSQ